MKRARKQNGTLYQDKNGSGVPVWMFNWRHTLPDGRCVRKKRQLGPLDQYKTEAAAEKAVRSWRLAINTNQAHAIAGITMSDVIEHFRQKELIDKGENGRAWTTRDRYETYLNRWIMPRWGKEQLESIKTPIVEEWLNDLKFDPNWRRKRKGTGASARFRARMPLQPLSPASKAKIRDLMSVLFNHAIRWNFADRNPISGPVRGSGVRQGSKRASIPDILSVAELQAIVAEVSLRERVLLCLDMSTGLRRGELAGLRWGDIDFGSLEINVTRSVVDQVVGRCKTESSQKPVPLDGYTARDLREWARYTPYRNADDWVFASNSARAGENRGKQPLWLSSVMRYHIQPVVRRLGINKRVSWHTFRRTYTTLLHANHEDVKVVQELLRHSSVKVTMDIYAQAQMPAKRAAQQKVVEMIRPEMPQSEGKISA